MQSQSATWDATARLLRRTGFGARGADVDAAVRLGNARYLQGILAADPTTDPGARATPPPSFTPVPPIGKSASSDERRRRNQQLTSELTELAGWWVRRMVAVDQPFGEKLTFCWHNHFATAASKVRQPPWLLDQNETLRRLGRGDFGRLALAMLTDAAMLRWLDGDRNTASAPNENLSREFMELFALGHGDGYTETDVREGARALTGWKIALDGTTRLNPRQHDDGSKTFLGVTGDLGVTQYCDAVLARSASAPFLATRWWGQLASNTAPAPGVVSAMAAAYGSTRDVSAMLGAMLESAAFNAAAGSIVVSPVEWVVGIVRSLHVPIDNNTAAQKLLALLRALGQVPFYPPNVSGWPSGQAWLSTAAADTRMQGALALARTADLSSLTHGTGVERLEAVGYLLGVGSWSDRSAAALTAELGNPARLVAVAVNTPEYLID